MQFYKFYKYYLMKMIICHLLILDYIQIQLNLRFVQIEIILIFS